jgi:hypothetical protein
VTTVSQSDTEWLALLIPVGGGTLIAGVAMLRTRRRARRLRESGKNPLLTKKVVGVAASRTEAINFVSKAISLSGGTIISTDLDHGQVLGKYGMTWRTYGQFLQVDLWDSESGGQWCVCTSWPTRDFVVTEWGAGFITINHFVELLGTITPVIDQSSSTTSEHDL